MAFDLGGHRHVVDAVTDDGVVAVVGRAKVRVGFGDRIAIDGKVTAFRPAPPSDDVVERVRRGLRRWRQERATTEKKPAYVFLHDRTLEALALAAPSSLPGLAAVSGIGPGKIEAYGEELLAVIATARADD